MKISVSIVLSKKTTNLFTRTFHWNTWIFPNFSKLNQEGTRGRMFEIGIISIIQGTGGEKCWETSHVTQSQVKNEMMRRRRRTAAVERAKSIEETHRTRGSKGLVVYEQWNRDEVSHTRIRSYLLEGTERPNSRTAVFPQHWIVYLWLKPFSRKGGERETERRAGGEVNMGICRSVYIAITVKPCPRPFAITLELWLYCTSRIHAFKKL